MKARPRPPARRRRWRRSRPRAHWLAARTLGLELPLLLFVATIPIVYLVGWLPVSLGGIGVVEGMFVLMGTGLGIGEDAALAIALLTQASMIFILVPGALACVTSDVARRMEGAEDLPEAPRGSP